jgi:glycosyltransferase involved in cell wall biosynthesis
MAPKRISVSSTQQQADVSLDLLDIAVLIPCHNEADAIERVILDFKEALPASNIYVYDNNCSDDTAMIARGLGAIVREESTQGKGNVVRRMFSDVIADIYILVDGDDTYEAAKAPEMVRHLIKHNLDMVNAARRTELVDAYRPGHRFGNRVLTSLVGSIFGNRIKDMLSGYRVFSPRFVKSFPALSSGFEIETELTVHALDLQMPVAEL